MIQCDHDDMTDELLRYGAIITILPRSLVGYLTLSEK